MKNSKAILFLVAICSSTALALKCISCSSQKEPKCTDAVGLQGEDCPEMPAEPKEKGVKLACLKAVIEDQGQKITLRECGAQLGQQSTCARYANFTKDCTVCDQDNCNGAQASTGEANPTTSPATSPATKAAPPAATAAVATTAATKAKAGSTAAPLKANKLVAIWTPVVGAFIAILFMYA